MQSVPLTPDEPPRKRPRLTLTFLPPTLSIGSVSMFQSVSESKFLLHLAQTISRFPRTQSSWAAHPPAICTFSRLALSGPASRTKTFALISSARRPAITHPDVPPLRVLKMSCRNHPQRILKLDAPTDDVVVDLRRIYRVDSFERHCKARYTDPGLWVRAL